MARKKDQERKRGLPPIQLRAAESASNVFPASWGSPAGGGLGGGDLATTLGLGGKVGVALLLSALGAGAFGVGRMIAPRGFDSSIPAQSLPFDRPGAPGAGVAGSAALPGGAQAESAMEVVPESLGDKDAQQRAADAAKAAAADQVAAAPPSPALSAMPATPPASATGLFGQTQKSPFTARFGQLTRFGAGHSDLNGGSGMSSGVGMPFSQTALGQPKSFGATTAAATRSAQARIAAISRPVSHAKGFAYNQLMRSNGLSRQGAAASGETSSTLAGAAFNNSPVGGQAITGGGAGTTPVTGAGAGATSGPIAQNTSTNGDGTQAPPPASSSNSSPWKMIAMAGVGAMALGAVLLTVAQMTVQNGKTKIHAAKAEMAANPQLGAADMAAGHGMIQQGKMMALMAAALGAGAAGIGLAMWQSFHQKSYGAIFMGGGAVIIALALLVLKTSDDDDNGSDATSGTVNPLNNTSQTDMSSGSMNLAGQSPAGGPAAPTAGPSTLPAGSYQETGVPSPPANPLA